MRLIKPIRKTAARILSLAVITFLLVAGAVAIAASASAQLGRAAPFPDSSRYREPMTAGARRRRAGAAACTHAKRASRGDEPGHHQRRGP